MPVSCSVSLSPAKTHPTAERCDEKEGWIIDNLARAGERDPSTQTRAIAIAPSLEAHRTQTPPSS